MVTSRVEIVTGEVRVDRKAGVFESFRANLFNHDAHELSGPHRQGHAFVVGGNAVLHRLSAIASSKKLRVQSLHSIEIYLSDA